MARGTGQKTETEKDQESTSGANEEVKKTTEEISETDESPQVEEVVEDVPTDENTEDQPSLDEEGAEEPEIKVDPKKTAANTKAIEKEPSRPKKKMFRIIIDQQDNSDKNGDVFVTDPSDGTPYQIRRDFEVDVPEGVVNNFKECIQERLEYDREGNERWRSIPRYAMRIIKEL